MRGEWVFQKVTDCIIHQGRLGCFGFIAKMVKGIDIEKCYLLGRSVFPPLSPLQPPVTLESLLIRACPALMIIECHLSTWSTWQWPNKLCANSNRNPVPLVSGPRLIACFAVDRGAEKTWALPVRVDGLVSTLRTCSEMIWSSQERNNGVIMWSRCLHPVECWALQGFPVELANCFSKADPLWASGNSFSLPVTIVVFGHWMSYPCSMWLDSWIRRRHCSNLQHSQPNI